MQFGVFFSALVSLLTMKEDKLTLEVACYDLGEFARFHPNGKKYVLSFLCSQSNL
jgi:hypothetical protein